MVEQWLLESGEHRPPSVPEGSDIAATLEAVETNPMASPDVDTIRAALTSSDVRAAYGGLKCLQQLQDHHPDLLNELDNEFLQTFQQFENPFVLGQVAELLNRQSEIEGDTEDLIIEFGELIDPQLPVRIRAPILRMLARGIEDNWMKFSAIESPVRESLTSSYPSVQAPALEILATVVDQGSTYDVSDYAEEVMMAVHVDDEAVQEPALRLLTRLLFEHPDVGRELFDRVAELMDAESPAVRRWAIQSGYGIGMENPDLLASVAPNFVSVLVGDDEEVRERLDSAFPDSPVTQFASRPVTNAIFWDDDVIDRIEPDRIVEWFGEKHVGSRAGIEPMILLAEIATRDPESVAPVGPLLESALTSGRAQRGRPLEDTAFLLGRLAASSPDLVDGVIESHLEALGEPGVDDELIVWELGHIAHGAPERVADAIGVTGAAEWPDDPFDDSVGARLCRGMLSTVAPGYAVSDDERSQAIVETAVTTYLDDEAEGYFGEVLLRIARTDQSLVSPYTNQLTRLVEGNFVRMRILGARILGAVEADEVLRRHQTDCRLTAKAIDETLTHME